MNAGSTHRLSPRAARAYAASIVERTFRIAPRKVRRRGGGLTNFVYQVDLPDLPLIVRINPNPERLAFFQRERRAMALARDSALPVPLVLTVTAMGAGGTLGEIAGKMAVSILLAVLLVGAFYVTFNWLIPRVLIMPTWRRNRDLPVLLTVPETASLLRTTVKAVYAMVERRQLPGVVRLGRRVLVRSEVLLNSLDQSRASSKE